MAKATHFFLGANSGKGFVSLFPEFCRPEAHRRLTILKGGPGCGKSTFMTRIGKAMESAGEEVEYLHCSGDPDSLDGVHMPRLGAAYVDGTAPHVVEPHYPGAADRILDLSPAYDLDMLEARRQEVMEGFQSCSEAYGRAKRAMDAAAQIEESTKLLAEKGLDREKLLRRGEGIAQRELRGKGPGGPIVRRFLGSYTCKGPVWRFDTVEQLCPRVWAIQDTYGLAGPMLELLAEAAEKHGWTSIHCPDPEHPEKLHHLILPELGIGFVTEAPGMSFPGEPYRRIRVDAMVDAGYLKAQREHLHRLHQMDVALREEAVSALGETKAAHDRLESLYRPCTGFASVDRALDRELGRLKVLL